MGIDRTGLPFGEEEENPRIARTTTGAALPSLETLMTGRTDIIAHQKPSPPGFPVPEPIIYWQGGSGWFARLDRAGGNGAELVVLPLVYLLGGRPAGAVRLFWREIRVRRWRVFLHWFSQRRTSATSPFAGYHAWT